MIVKRSRGFTLIELAIVISVVGVVAVMAMPAISNSIRSLRLNNAAQKLASDIRYVRSLALSQHGSFGIDFDQDNNSVVDTTTYSLFQLSGGTQTTITDPHTNANMVINYGTQPAYSGVTIASAGSTELRIDSSGIPYNAAGTALSSVMTIVLQSGSLTRSVQITQTTGFVEIV